MAWWSGRRSKWTMRGLRFDTFAGQMCPHHHLKSCVNQEHQEENTHVCLHCTTSALRSGMHCCQRTSRLRCIRRVVKKKRDTCGKWTERCIPGTHEGSSQKKQDLQHSRYVTKSITALRRTRWLQSTATTSSRKENPRNWVVWMRY